MSERTNGAPAPALVVLGAGGQVGHELVRALAPLGRVVALDRAACDLGDPGAAAAAVRAERPSIVVNAAAYTAVDAAEDDEERSLTINAVAPGAIARACAELGTPFVHYSTDYVFDGGSTTPYTEDDAPSPTGAYGRTKLEGEALVAASGAAYVVLRTSWVYDARRGRNFVRTMLRLAREREELRVVDDQHGAPTWARMIAEGTAHIVGAALRDARGPEAWVRERAGVYHLAAAGATTWHAFAGAVLAADPARAEQRARRVDAIATADFPTRARRPAYSVLDSSRAARVFGVRLPDWREQLALAMRD